MLPSKRIKRQPRASLLPGVLLCVILATVSASMPAREKCPDHIDCAREGRHFCKPGTSYCGPCLNPLDENEEGLCVARKSRRHHGKVTSFSDLDEEIDFLHSVIAKQEVSEIKQSDTRSKAARTQTEAPRMRGQVQPSAGQPNTTQPSIHTPQPATGALGRVGAGGPDGLIAVPYTSKDSLLVIMISVCVIVGAGGLILATLFWVRLQKESRLAQKIDYPAFGSHGNGTANRTSSGDKKLAQSAQMYHYQHQKQQMLSMENHKSEPKVADSEVTSDEEEVDGDFTVYECPGLAPTGEMEVKNPLFNDSTLHYQGNPK
ncbi:neural proliferation differentiation and control protein 1-like [Salvelinus namaycush]|uniref:Neural proliferation differentiation and control protein 1-like n=1 Tax=Salvelinus namaycush TaxID=8040 RepID=A0A8U0PAW8_SALNM|nr:neural proliferation differentiation and control protein 1-like [Salvelinus namaycush]